MPSKKKKSTKKNASSTTSVAYAVGTKKVSVPAPKQTYLPNGNCLVSHMEYIQDVSTLIYPGATIGIECNPQNGTMFTWLSAIATRFEMYKFRKLRFMYKPSASTTTEGFVILGFDFDVYDSIPTKNVVLTWKYSSKAAVWQSVALDVSGDARMQTARYCNSSSVQGDSRLDFLGKFWCLAASSGTSFAGELFVDYAVEFMQPSYQLPPVLYAGFTNPAATGPDQFFANLSLAAGNLSFVITDFNKLTIKDAGKFLVTTLCSGSAISTTPNWSISAPTGSVTSNWSAGEIFDRFASGSFSANQFLLNVTTPPVLLTMAGLPVGASSLLRISTYAGTS